MEILAGLNAAGEALVDWWRAANGPHGGIPAKTSFNPLHHKQILPFLFLLERDSPDSIRARVVGTRIDDWFGTGLTGANLLDLSSDDYTRQQQAFYYNTLLDCPCAGHLSRFAFREDDERYVYNSFHLPLLDDEGAPRFLIGVGLAETAAEGYSKPSVTQHDRTLHREFRFVDIGHGVPDHACEAVAS